MLVVYSEDLMFASPAIAEHLAIFFTVILSWIIIIMACNRVLVPIFQKVKMLHAARIIEPLLLLPV